MTENKEIWEQLRVLKDLTETTGSIHEAQVTQLKIWAQCLFGSTDIEIDIEDVPTVRFKANSNAPMSMDTLKGLDRSVKSVLGDYFAVIVINKDITIFNSFGTRARKKV